MAMIIIFGLIGSYVLGLIDTKIGTKKSMMIAIAIMILVGILIGSALGARGVFIFSLVAGIIAMILILLFKASRVKEIDDKYRKAAGKPLDDALANRK